MDCTTCREALSAALDGEGLPGEVGRVDAHLATCPACRAHDDELHRLHRRLRLRPAEPVPDLTGAILAATAGGPAGSTRSGRPRWSSVRVAAAAVVVVLVGLGAAVAGTWRQGGGPEGSAPLVEVTDAYATTAPRGGLSAVYLTLHNHGSDEDALVQVDSEAAGLVELHATVTSGAGRAVMRTVDEFPLGPGSRGTVRAGRSHVMLVDLARPLRPGDQLTLVLHFGHAPAVRLQATVVDDATALARGGAARTD